MLGGQYSSRYEEIELLGRNPQDDSEMYLVKDTQNQQFRMAKKLSIFDSNFEEENQLLNEVALLKDLSHPHILRYYDIHLEGDTLVSLLQFCEEGDLASYLQKKRSKKQGLSQKLLVSWLMQLLMGLEYIHNKHIIHRLIASRNVYLNHQGDLKIGSFGSAKVLENTLKKAVTVVTMPCNMSPQMVQGEPYTNKADIWALGCLIYEMASFKPLYNFGNLAQLYDLIVQKPSAELPVKYGKYLNPIFRKMMKKNPHQRPSATQLLQQQVFVSLMKQYVKKKKIDSLDLKYMVPKKLGIHKAAKEKGTPKKEKVKLPPISPNLNHQNSNFNSTAFAKNKNLPSLKSDHGENRAHSRERKKTSQNIVENNNRMEESDEIPERITKINEKEGINISHICEAKLTQILEKYKPSLGLIYQKTFDFEEL